MTKIILGFLFLALLPVWIGIPVAGAILGTIMLHESESKRKPSTVLKH